MLKSEIQTIYINIDDSGKISKNEKIAVYGGIIFLSKKEKDKFITQYRCIISQIKCKYCGLEKTNCNENKCPELKHNNLSTTDKRRLINYIKKYMLVACIINNNKIYDYILDDKSSKGRYADYCLRITIKKIILKLISDNTINPNKPIKIVINIDEQSTKSNGYYNLKDGLIEELKYGVMNFNYNKRYKPIIYSDLDIKLTYQHSDKSYVIQAADLVAGTVRRKNILYYNDKISLKKHIAFVHIIVFLP